MNEEARDRILDSYSDTVKSKCHKRLCRRTWMGVVTLAILLSIAMTVASAQQPGKNPRIGYISSECVPSNPGRGIEVFRQGLRELGYFEGKNIQVDYRFIQGQSERIADLVSDLIQSNPDVLVTANFAATRAAKQQTNTIPILFNITEDPVLRGLVKSLAKPGGNLTGVATLGRELSGKRLELFLEAIPSIKRIGVLFSPASLQSSKRVSRGNIEDYEIPARALKIAVRSAIFLNTNQEIERAVRELVKTGANALVVISTSPLFPFRVKVADLAIRNRTPLLAEDVRWVEDGALMTYSTNPMESNRRIAVHVDKILRGAKPADIPVEQPMKFDFVINLKTAKQIGVTIPQSVLFRADRVIK